MKIFAPPAFLAAILFGACRTAALPTQLDDQQRALAGDVDSSSTHDHMADTIAEIHDVTISTVHSATTVRPIFESTDEYQQHIYKLRHPHAPTISVHFKSKHVPDGCALIVTTLARETLLTTTFLPNDQTQREWSHQVIGSEVLIIAQCDNGVGSHNMPKLTFEVDKYAAGFTTREAADNFDNRRLPEDDTVETNGMFSLVAEGHTKQSLGLRGRSSTSRRDGSVGHVNDDMKKSWQRDIQSAYNMLDDDAASDKQNRRLAICGESELQDAKCFDTSEHPSLYRKTNAVARLIINGVRACTGFLVGNNNYFMTGHHCVSSQHDVDNTDFHFMVDDRCGGTSADSLAAFPGETLEGNHKFIQGYGDWDMTLIQLDGNPIATYGYLYLAETHKRLERIFIPQHPNARAKEVAMFDFYQGDGQPCRMARDGLFTYTCDTQKGSSGAPIISYETHEVLGIHKKTSNIGCFNMGTSAKEFYSTVRSTIYVDSVVTNEPTSAPTESAADRTGEDDEESSTTRTDGGEDNDITAVLEKVVCASSIYCGQPSRMAPNTDLHPVRCCSNSPFSDARPSTSCDGVWAQSRLNGVCSRAATFVEAEALCASSGARLCTPNELEMNCAWGSGCRLERTMVWSQESATAAIISTSNPVKSSKLSKEAFAVAQSSTP